MDKQFLNSQMNNLEKVLAEHGALARVWGGHLTPSSIVFCLKPAPTTQAAVLEQCPPQAIALALGVTSASIVHCQGSWSSQIPRPDAAPIVKA